MPEQVPEIQEAIDRERQRRRGAEPTIEPGRYTDGEIDDATLGRLVHEIGTDAGVGR